MYGFLTGLNSPESIFDKKYLFPVLSPLFKKQEICQFSKIALFHINCYFIAKVSPIYGFLAGFSSSESIFAEKLLISFFVTTFQKYRKCVVFSSKIALFHFNCYFIGKVSPVLVLRNSFLLIKLLISCFVTIFQKQDICQIFSKIAFFHINCYFIGKVSPMYGFLAGFSSLESIFAENITYFLFCHHFSKKEGNMSIFPKSHYFTSIVTS